MPTTLHDIDFATLYRQHKRLAGRPATPVGTWDERAQVLYDQPLESAYTRAFIQRMDFTGASTLLDVGCGAGNIAVQVARRLDAVYGMDYSPVMLDVLAHHARACRLDNVHAVQASWDSSWDSVPRCDIVVASRSTLVDDMGDALSRLHDHARLRVYITYPVSGLLAQPHHDAAAGGRAVGQPSYLYILNILQSRGIDASLNYIHTPNRQGDGTVRWAFISWGTQPHV